MTSTRPGKPRFLLDKARQGDGHGYTDIPELAMRHEPECLDEHDWERHIGRHVDPSLHARQMERERTVRLLSQEERIAKAVAEAQEKRRDVSSELAFLRHMQQINRAPDAIERRLQGLERIAYLGKAA